MEIRTADGIIYNTRNTQLILYKNIYNSAIRLLKHYNNILSQDKMKNQILQCLNLSLVPDSNTIKSATLKLSELSKEKGYCLVLMEIGDDQNQNLGIRQSALVQFKNTVKKYWSSQQNAITQQEKQAILGALMPAFIRSSTSFPLLKIYKDIVSIIINEVYKFWIPVQAICSMLNKNQNAVAILHFIIGIQTNFQISIQKQQRQIFYQFVIAILPTLYTYVQSNTNEQVIYLIMKIIWKIVHFEVSHQVRTALCSWMDLILNVAGASNQALQSKISEEQQKGTVQFFYFHAKKWATRILFRFILRHASPNSSLIVPEDMKKINKQFSKTWYENFGKRVVETVVKQFLVPSIKKTRYFQLKCLTELVNIHPQEMKQYAETFQYKILPPYLQLEPEDEQLANSDPLQFLNKESDLSFSYTHLKRQAKQAWIAFTNIGAKKKKKNKPEEVGTLFNQNMKWIRSKLQNNSNPLQKEMAMYLICQLRSSIKNCDQIKEILPALIGQFVVPQFTSQIMFLRARSMQIFDEYGDLLTNNLVIKKAVEGIYFCLTQDNYPLVRLKAASAFHILLQHEQARKQVKLLFKEILKIYLFLMQKYDSQSLVFSLSGIVQHFGTQIGPYACQLMKYLSKHFIKLFTKDKQQAKDPEYDGQTELAAAGVLGTMKTLLQSPIEKQNIIKMEADILDVCDCVFSNDDADYIDDCLSVLRAYTSRIQTISQKLIFYYVVIIYYVIGIERELWDKIDQLSIPETSKKCLHTVRSGCNIQTLDSAMLILRNYIAIDSSLLLKTNDPFGVNLLQLLFKMVNQIYQKGPNEFEGQVQMNSCTILMAYLLQNNHKKWDERMMTHIWQVVKYNLLKARSKILKSINAQLISLMMWNDINLTMKLATADNLVNQMLVCMLNSEVKVKQQHERQRMILGMSQFLLYPNRSQQMLHLMPKIFSLLITYVKKNCEYRVDDECQENYLTESEEEDEEQVNIHLDINEDEPEDIWEEDFQRNYSSKLDEIDQIKIFRDSIHRLKSEQTAVYNQLISITPPDQLCVLEEKITKAIAAYNENN